jgi:hypothetical protein
MARVRHERRTRPFPDGARGLRRLAWRLLFGSAIEDAVRRLLACALAIYCVGCIVPTPLEAETPPPNHAPQIIGGYPDFVKQTPFSPPVNGGMSSGSWAFSVTAVDLDVADTLAAHLYVNTGGALAPEGQIVLTATSDPTVRTGQFQPANYCALGTPGESYYFYVYVSDRPFPEDNNPAELKQGDFAFAYWVVQCP